MAESGPGKIYLFEDFLGQEYALAHTGAVDADTFTGMNVGPFKILGDLAETDTGCVTLPGVPSGAARLSGNNEDGKGAALVTETSFVPSLMGQIVVEARVQFAAITTRNFFVGVCDARVNDVAPPLVSATTTHTLSASDLAGFHFDSGLTAGTTMHTVFNGGTTTGETDSDNTITSPAIIPTAAEWDVLRIEIETNGTVRYIFNGAVVKTVENAVSTTVAQCAMIGMWGTTTTVADVDIDYFMVAAQRDWTR